MYKDNEMNIIYRSENQQFHLFNQEISYIFKISEDGKLLHLYYGENLPDNDYSHLIEMHHRPMTTYRNENDLLYSLEHLNKNFLNMVQQILDILLFHYYRKMALAYQILSIKGTKWKKENLN